MKQLILVFLGGGMGSVLRFLVSSYFNSSGSPVYLGTFLVNILGCLLIGLILGLSVRQNWVSTETTLLLGVGFCGGFTTFSTFSYEQYALLKTASIVPFLLYTFGSILLGFAAILLGTWVSRIL